MKLNSIIISDPDLLHGTPVFKGTRVRDERWLGIKNGYLIQLAINAGFNVFITNDQNLGFQ